MGLIFCWTLHIQMINFTIISKIICSVSCGLVVCKCHIFNLNIYVQCYIIHTFYASYLKKMVCNLEEFQVVSLIYKTETMVKGGVSWLHDFMSVMTLEQYALSLLCYISCTFFCRPCQDQQNHSVHCFLFFLFLFIYLFYCEHLILWIFVSDTACTRFRVMF